MDLFEKIGLVKILDGGEIYLSQIDELIGKETDKAQIMRRKRAEDKALKEIGNNVTKMLPKCYTEKEIDIEKEKDIYKRFIKPTLDEVKEYCLERKNSVDYQKFYDFYESKGWMVGKNKMKDWKACVRTWEKSSKQQTSLKNACHDTQFEDLSKFYV